MVLSKAELVNNCLDFFKGDELAADVWTKYGLKNERGQYVEASPDIRLQKISREFARIESKYQNPLSYEQIYEQLKDFSKIIPQGSPLSGIANDYQLQSISNCFVIDSPHDSYAGILKTDQEQVQIMKRRGGVGFDISTIRPKGMQTSNSAGTTDGIGIFMERFSNSCREVAQGGRRGALLLSISCRHPEIETFINIKKDLKKVTGANISIRFSDEFMQAVSNDQEFTLQWPVDVPQNEAKIVKVVKAKQIWDKFVDASWSSAEPGALFWDTIIRNSIPDLYSEFGYRTISTNPCLAGDVEVAVADGRGFVKIKDLAVEGVDVPVYAIDQSNGKIAIKTMRNPRITGYSQKLYKVTIEGGHSFKATGNHKMLMKDGTEKQICDIIPGDSLWVAHHVNAKFSEAIPNIKTNNSQKYSWIRNNSSKTWQAEHRLIWEFNEKQKLLKNQVIHHVDFNSLNNSFENLKMMSKEEHDAYHGSLIKGKNNPIFKIKANKEKFKKYSLNMSNAVSGLKNPRAFDISNEQILNEMKNLTIQLKRRITPADWMIFAKSKNYPRRLNKFRLNEKSFYEISSNIATELGINDLFVNLDPRIVKRILEAEDSHYDWRLLENHLEVKRVCEYCKSEYWTKYFNREISFCGSSCSNLYANRIKNQNVKRTLSLQKMHQENSENNKLKQTEIFVKLRYENGKIPTLKQWEMACKLENCTSRLGTKYGFKNWPELKQSAENFNHKVVSIEEAGFEDVYNGTVDDLHTFCFRVGKESIEKMSEEADILLGNRQCGELVLSKYDSCRLMVLNTLSFVVDRFKKGAFFDFQEFEKSVMIAQRLMDDTVDLELECIDKILKKIEAEDININSVEIALWKKIREAAANGRRTGLGITAIGDTVAAVGLKYDSEEAIELISKIYKTLAVGAHKSSLHLAAERGHFSIWSYEKEKDFPYLNKIMNACGEDYKSMWKTTGRRNIGLTTTAPVGSISCLTKTTSGIEPAIFLSYKRRRKMTSQDTCEPDFIDDLGDKWQEYTVYHHGLEEWMQKNPGSKIEDSPYYRSTANEINWLQAPKVQSAAQEWIDHSISKTANLPQNVTKKQVSDLYFEAWRSGCKGFTIYRDGTRDGVLVSNDSKPQINLQETHATKRPAKLKCDIHRITVRNKGTTDKWIVLVGMHNSKPYEIFAGNLSCMDFNAKIKSGIIEKIKSENGNQYILEIQQDNVSIKIDNVIEAFQNSTNASFTRTISLSLRHNIPIQFICEQLQKDTDGDMFTFAKGIARVLKTYIKDGTQISKKKCPSCGADSLVYQEGCVSCNSCSFSKCG